MKGFQYSKTERPSNFGKIKESFFGPFSEQTKLTVSAAGDQNEQEADNVAEKVVSRLSEATPDSEHSKSVTGDLNFLNSNKPSPPIITALQGKSVPSEKEENESSNEGEIQRKPKFLLSHQTYSDNDMVISTEMSKNDLSTQTSLSNETANRLYATKGSGEPLPNNAKSEMEAGFGSDFSNVRIHTDTSSTNLSRSLNAMAFTHGSDIYFNSSKFETQSHEGKKLLAHELTHVIQQSHKIEKTIMRTVDEASVEAEYNQWAEDNQRTKDKTHAEFPLSVWEFIQPQIVDFTMKPLPKPAETDKVALEKWNDNFAKAEIMARWLFTLKSNTNNTSIKSSADTNGFNILDSLAKAGFVSKVIAQSGYLDSSTRKLVYDTILSNPSIVSDSEFETIVSFQCNGVTDPTSVPIVQVLTNGNDSPLKHLNADQTKGIFNPLISKYGSKDTIIEAFAEVLMFNPPIRTSISDALMKSTFGNPEILFKVLEHPYFKEPGYGASILSNLKPTDLTTEEYEGKRMKDDMPWVYSYKQKYYVQFLIDLAKGQSITIAQPTAMTFSGLKKWLEANTEKIGESASKKYPSEPEKIFNIYENIADIFFFHIPHDRDVEPDLEGKISHLNKGEPSKQRFEADCDVFATYAMRLFFNAGFDAVGYIAFVPEGKDASRSAHVAALIRKDGAYSVINNKGILNTGITEAIADDKKLDALKKLRKLSFEDAYGIPRPTELNIYYADAEAKGKMSKLFKDQDSSLKRTDL